MSLQPTEVNGHSKVFTFYLRGYYLVAPNRTVPLTTSWYSKFPIEAAGVFSGRKCQQEMPRPKKK
jgi:hypothetical protein